MIYIVELYHLLLISILNVRKQITIVDSPKTLVIRGNLGKTTGVKRTFRSRSVMRFALSPGLLSDSGARPANRRLVSAGEHCGDKAVKRSGLGAAHSF